MSSPLSARALRLCLRLVLVLSLGLAGLARGQTVTAPAWLHKARAGNVVYFTFASPARIERYDLASGAWLSSISLPNTPSAFAVDESGMTLAYGRALYTRNLDGTGEAALYNASADLKALLHTPSFIVAAFGGYSQNSLITIRRSDRQFIGVWSGYYSFSAGLSIDPAARRIYGSDSYLQSITFNVDGTWSTSYPGYLSGSSSYGVGSPPRTYVSPDGALLIGGSGYVFDPVSLGYRASLAGAFTDLAFHGNDTSIVLRDTKLVAYSNTFLESGSATLPKVAQGVAVSGGSVFAFSADAAAATGISVTKLALSSFSTAVPGAAPDPSQLSFLPDDVIATGDDTLLIYSKTHQAVFEWSAKTASYGAAYALRGAPSALAYSAALDRLYTGYATGEIRQIKLDEGASTEVPFVNLPAAVGGLQTAGDLVFAVDPSGAWNTYSVFNADGVKKSSREWSDYSRNYVWSPLQRRMYHFRDDTSPNDLEYDAIGADGSLGAEGETPYHGDYSFVHPIRLSSDETGVLTGGGVIFSATSLSYTGSLANAITDAVSLDKRWHTIRPSGVDTQLQIWTSNYLFDRGLAISGYPLRIFALSDGRLLVLTSSDTAASTNYPYGAAPAGRIVFSYVDLAGSGTISTPAFVVTPPASATVYRGRPATLSVVAGGTAPFTYQWRFKGEPIPGATAATFTLSSVKDSDAGDYTVTVSNVHGSSTSAVASLTVATPPPLPVITTQPQSRTVSLSTYSLSLSVSATGSPLSYQWYKNDSPIVGATAYYLNLYPSSAGASIYGDYHVVVSNLGGDLRSATATLSPPPAPTLSNQPQSRYALVGQSVSFSVTATSQDLVYRWRRNGVDIPGATTSTLTFVAAETDFADYDVVVSNTAGSVVSEIAKLARAQSASVSTQPDSATVPLGGDASFRVVATGAPATFTYRWQRYSPASKSWVNLVADLYYFSGVETDTLIVTNATLAQNGLIVRCAIANGFGASVFSASATLTVDVAANPPIAFVLQPVSQTVPLGSAVAFTAVTNSVTPPYCQWFHDGVAIPGANSPTLLLPSVAATDAGNYSLFAQNSRGALMSQAATLVINDAPAAPAVEAVASNLTAYVGASVTLRVRASGQPAPALVWTKDGKPVPDAFGASLLLDPVSLSDAGLYRVTAVNASGSAAVDIRLSVRPPAPPAPALGTLLQGQLVSLDLSVEASVPELRYRASGLPSGLALDPVSGLLSGELRAKPGTYRVKAWTELGSARSEVVSAEVLVSPFPAAFLGAFEGLLLLNDDSSPLPSGLLRLTVAASGEFTGSLLRPASARALALKGRLRPEADGASAWTELTLPGGELLVLTFSADEGSAAQLRVEGATTELAALHPLLPAGAPAVDWAGPCTLAFGPPQATIDIDIGGGTGGVIVIGGGGIGINPIDPSEVGPIVYSHTTRSTRAANTTDISTLPRGHGCATGTFAANGRLSARGKLADGTVFTATLPADTNGGYRCFVRPHAAGSNFFAGAFTLGQDEHGYGVDEFLGAQSFHWQKAPQPRDTVHPAGFDAAPVSLTLASWTKPRAGDSLATLLGASLAPAPATIFVEFPQADEVNTAGLPLGLTVSNGAKFALDPATPAAAARAWQMNINLLNGSFSGRFLLPSQLTPLKGKNVSFEGVLLPGRPGFARGYFILPRAQEGAARQSGAIAFSWTE